MDLPIDLNVGVEILTQLAKGHYYANDIVNIIENVTPLINENEQLHDTLINIINQTDFVKSHTIKWSDLNHRDKEVMDNFFDYLYFTSPQFLKEAP